MSFTIENNVPCNFTRRNWPFKNMNVGESVFLSHADFPRAAVVAHTNGSQQNKKFKTRKVTENNIEGIRIWRVS